MIAVDHGWKLRGDQIVEESNVAIAGNLEEVARKALFLNWFDPAGVTIH